MTGDSYVKVKVRVRRWTADAALLSPDAEQRRQAWVPRSHIHGVDEATLEDVRLHDEVIILRIFRWKAEEMGFVPTEEGQQELFG